jgi:serine protease Do
MPEQTVIPRVCTRWLVGVTLAWAGLTSILFPAPSRASELRRTAIVRAVEEARDAVVNIHGRKTVRAEEEPLGADRFRQVNGMGTGVVIDPRGYVITNYHVVEGVSRIQVTLADNQTLVAQLVAHDQKTDLAVIKLSLDRPMPVIRIGKSSDLMLGEPVIAIGNAYGYSHTVTRGITSALNRAVQVSDEQHYDNLIQTDASINPGNSGGPLLNIDGEMIGVNVAVRVGAQGIGFAIPVDDVMEVAARLMSVERLERLTHGVAGTTTVANDTPRFVVASIRKNSPAEKSGLQAGDVITAVAETRVDRALDFERALLGRKAGEEVAVSIARGGQPLTLNLALANLTVSKPAVVDRTWDLLGLKLEPIAFEDFVSYNSRYRGGLKVTAVRPEGPAARQGIRRGDVLVGMHIWETISMDNVAYILNRPDFQQLQPVKFFILRGAETLYGHMSVSAGIDR